MAHGVGSVVQFTPRFPGRPLLKYPGMSRDDSLVWDKFLRSDRNHFKGLSYNVRVGSGEPCPDDADAALRRDVYAFSALRIDAVGVTDDEIWIVEVKPRMNLAAIGQLQAYGELFGDHFEVDKEMVLALVCERTVRDLTRVYDSLGLEVIVV